DAADLGHRALRAPVGVGDPEDRGIDEAEGMIEHQPLDFAVGGAAPMRADNKSPADLDFAELRLITMVAAGADQGAGRAFDKCKTHLRVDRAVEKFPEP